jgi:NTP pyrophosphatase (non-canonical NTP hydrolase)
VTTSRLEDSGPGREEADEWRLTARMMREMDAKLAANRHKRHWRDADVTDDYLMQRLVDECGELFVAIKNGEPRWAEAADVANIAAMLADRE